MLTEEVINLERNSNSGKIDHPDNGRFGSKDISDAVCGAIFNASQHAEEFSYQYGDSVQTVVDFNLDTNNIDDILRDFENDLKKKPENVAKYIDFGLSQPESVGLFNDGILI